MKSNLNSEEGFTFIEALVSLMVSSIILVLLTGGILQAQVIQDALITQANDQTADYVIGNRQIEWHIFLNQLGNYLEGTSNPIVGNKEVKVDEWDEVKKVTNRVTYRSPSANQTRLTRFKKNGNEIMLTDLKLKNFSKMECWLIVEVTFKNGETYSGRIWVESWKD